MRRTLQALLAGAILLAPAVHAGTASANTTSDKAACKAAYSQGVKYVEKEAQKAQKPWLDKIEAARKNLVHAKSTNPAGIPAAQAELDKVRNEALYPFSVIINDANDMVEQLKDRRKACLRAQGGNN